MEQENESAFVTGRGTSAEPSVCDQHKPEVTNSTTSEEDTKVRVTKDEEITHSPERPLWNPPICLRVPRVGYLEP